MKANTRNLEEIFDGPIRYDIPLFQRPYVWTQEKNWEPLWEDIQSLLDRHLRGAKVHPHFLGAAVLEQLPSSTASIQCRQVIDGQQRFTTLQIFLIAARDQAAKHVQKKVLDGKYAERFADLAANKKSRIEHADEVFKIWPTNSDRPAFRLVHGSSSRAELDRAVKVHPEFKQGQHNVIDAYRYFDDQLGQWIAGKLDDEGDEAVLASKSLDDRFESLWQTVKGLMQIVVIDLEKGDETQVIFETLNARGEELLPADLIKNYLFRRGVANDDDVQMLYDKHWSPFDATFWREQITQGRIKRPRIDIYMQHYLTLMTKDDIKTSHLFNAFKAFEQNVSPPEGSSIPYPTSPSEHIVQMARYASIFRTFQESGDNPRLTTFLQRLDAVDTGTVFPFLLHACAELLPDRPEELGKILTLLESFLIRRMVCGLTPKNYNRFFVDLIRATEKSDVSAAGVADYLGKNAGDSTRFPDDAEFGRAIMDRPLYLNLSQKKVRAILAALDAQAYNRKSEAQALPEGLTIEHVMPQAWMQNWPIPDSAKVDPVSELKFANQRHLLVNTLGNLTLITDSLNPSLSNGPWDKKAPELRKFAKLNLTQYFHDVSEWDEAAISKRGEKLLGDALKIWPNVDKIA